VQLLSRNNLTYPLAFRGSPHLALKRARSACSLLVCVTVAFLQVSIICAHFILKEFFFEISNCIGDFIYTLDVMIVIPRTIK